MYIYAVFNSSNSDEEGVLCDVFTSVEEAMMKYNNHSWIQTSETEWRSEYHEDSWYETNHWYYRIEKRLAVKI